MTQINENNTRENTGDSNENLNPKAWTLTIVQKPF